MNQLLAFNLRKAQDSKELFYLLSLFLVAYKKTYQSECYTCIAVLVMITKSNFCMKYLGKVKQYVEPFRMLKSAMMTAGILPK